MPICKTCERSVPSSSLMAYGNDLICLDCSHADNQGPKIVTRSSDMAEPVTTTQPRQIGSVSVFEVHTSDGGKDHMITIQAKVGGLNLAFEATIDQIRKFFTEQRKKEEKKAVLRPCP